MQARWWRRWPAGWMRGPGKLAKRARRTLAGAHRRRGHTALRSWRGRVILQQLATCGCCPTHRRVAIARGALYQQALDQLIAQGHAYPCACSRKDIEDAHAAQGHDRTRHAALPYPGTCRHGLRGRPARSWRFNTTDFKPKHPLALIDKAQAATFSIADGTVRWTDRRLGPQRSMWPARWATLCCAAQTACGPTSWPWWWTMRPAHHPCGARRRPGRQHTAPDPAAAGTGGADTQLPAHAPGLWCQRRKALQTKWRRSARSSRSLAGPGQPPGCSAFLPWSRFTKIRQPEALEMWVNAWARTYNGPP
jgi:glutamyl-Q tRNA(Asp) synthetase